MMPEPHSLLGDHSKASCELKENKASSLSGSGETGPIWFSLNLRRGHTKGPVLTFTVDSCDEFVFPGAANSPTVPERFDHVCCSQQRRQVI